MPASVDNRGSRGDSLLAVARRGRGGKRRSCPPACATGAFHRLLNAIASGSKLLLKIAGNQPANVVSSVMARQARAIMAVEGPDRILIGGAAQAPVVIASSCFGPETRR